MMKSLLLKTGALALVAAMGVSCQTTYDAQGNPVQTVDPAAAAAGAAAAGAAGYAIGRHNSDRNYYYGRPRYYRPHPRW